MATVVRPEVMHFPKAPPQERDAVELVMASVLGFEGGLGSAFKAKLDERYRQYRGFRKLKYVWEQAGPNDKDGVLLDAKQAWGANLHIPLSYRTVETMAPRAIAHRPHMLYLPRQERWEQNVESVRLLIDSQQENIDIDLPFQMVMRSGFINGIGMGKAFWRKEYAPRRRIKRRTFLPDAFKVGKLESACIFDDPDFEDVDMYDAAWDPYGSGTRGPAGAGW